MEELPGMAFWFLCDHSKDLQWQSDRHSLPCSPYSHALFS